MICVHSLCVDALPAGSLVQAYATAEGVVKVTKLANGGLIRKNADGGRIQVLHVPSAFLNLSLNPSRSAKV